MDKTPQLEIIYEDSDLLVINKPRNMHSVENNTDFESGLLQRLDYETTGCMLAAKTDLAFNYLKDQFKQHLVKKEYLLLVEGNPEAKFTAENYIGSRYRRSKKVTISKEPLPRFLYAKTEFTLLKRIKDCSIVSATTYYGRRHQVRAQAADAGFSLVGDDLYGSTKQTSDYIENAPKFILHAENLSFKHPSNNKEIKICAKQPFYLRCLPHD